MSALWRSESPSYIPGSGRFAAGRVLGAETNGRTLIRVEVVVFTNRAPHFDIGRYC
jgi:hypothetical protein